MGCARDSSIRRRIGLVALPGAQALEIAGPYDVFRRADYFSVESSRSAAYQLLVLGMQPGLVGPRDGLQLMAPHSFTDAEELDTLLVIGGFETPFLPLNGEFATWLHTKAFSIRRICSVCAGVFALAEAGLLKGRRAACHWGHAELFRQRFPDVLLDADPIFIRDGHIYTSAGVTAGMDLALALVEEDLGRASALEVARSMVLFLRRPGSQSQFSVPLTLQSADRKSLRELQDWMQDHLGSNLTVRLLAERAGMSARHFARVFAKEAGMTPSRYVDKLRVDAARRRLEESDQPLKVVAAETGFGAVEAMRRSFVKEFHTTPGAYRRRFQSAFAGSSLFVQ